MNSGLVQMMQSGEFSDLTLICNGQEFKVHKAVICTQSPTIKAALQGGFKESHTNVIAMDEFSTKTVGRFIEFLYTGDYDNHRVQCKPISQNTIRENESEVEEVSLLVDKLHFGDDEKHDTDASKKATAIALWLAPIQAASLSENVEVNAIGDYYGVGKLVSLANAKIKHLLQNDGRKQDCMADLPIAIDMAAQSTGDKELLEMLASTTATHLSNMLRSSRFLSLGVLSDFSIKLLQSCVREIQARADQHQASECQLREERDRHARSKEEISRLEHLLEILNSVSGCRNCSAEFVPCVRYGERVLRCSKCSCRHF